MKVKRCTFTRRSHFGKSLACAALLLFCVYAILPLSISADLKNPQKEKMVRVYSVRDSFQGPRVSEREEAKAPNRLPQVPSAAKPQSAPGVSIDYSDCALSIPGLPSQTRGEFGITDFPQAGGDFKVAAFEISELDSVPKRLSGVRVKYPPDMLRRGIEGMVRLNVSIDETGALEVESVAESTNALFEASAIEAVRNLRYEIPKKNGVAVRAKFVLPIPFKIQK